jgi:hypothetical protein
VGGKVSFGEKDGTNYIDSPSRRTNESPVFLLISSNMYLKIPLSPMKARECNEGTKG